MEVRDIKIEDIQIVENVRIGKNDREIIELMQSIKQDGLFNPIVVFAGPGGKYILEQGMRRLTAFKKLGWTTIPAQIKVTEGGPKSRRNMLIAQSAENIQRRDISPRELGRIVHMLISDEKMTVSEIAARFGKSVNKINSAYLIYKDTPSEYRDQVVFMGQGTSGFGADRQGKISADAAMSILNIRSKENLSRIQTKQLFALTKEKELGGDQLATIGALIATGLDIKQAVKIADGYKSYALVVLAERSVLEPVAKKAGVKPRTYLQNIIYGLCPPIKKPDILIKKGSNGVK